MAGGNGASGLVILYGTVTTGTSNLTISSGSGYVTLGALGKSVSLTSLTINSTSTNANNKIDSIISGITALTYNGTAGKLSVNGVNTYTGLTIISAGTVAISTATGLGATGGATTVSSTGALEISGGITVAEPITIAGTGVSSGGAIAFTSGNNTYSGDITLATSASSIKSTSGSQIISGAINGAQALTITATDNLTLSGTIGATAPPSSLSVIVTCDAACTTATRTGLLALNADVSTSGTQGYTAAGGITINANRTLTTTPSAALITLSSALNGNSNSLINTNLNNQDQYIYNNIIKNESISYLTMIDSSVAFIINNKIYFRGNNSILNQINLINNNIIDIAISDNIIFTLSTLNS
jgi:autotransporter-associated beta strand protein